MKSLISLIVLLPFFVTLTHAQTIINSRSSVLKPGGYSITGKAFLEEFDDGSLKLRLDDDFSTPRGPDVRIFLSDNPNSTRNSVEVGNIGTRDNGINHFSGAVSFDVPAGISIDQYDHLVFYCVAFSQHWASGDFDAATGNNGDNGGGSPTAFECQETIAATTNWATSVTVCPNDGEADIIPLLNTLMIPPGDHYAYIITDENNRIEKVITQGSYNFEGSGVGINRVYGVSFDTNLEYTVGSPLTSITASGCAILSDNAIFLTVTKEDCTPAFECQETIVATTNWVSEVTVCPNDGEADVIPFLNTQMIPAGEHYAYIITDENNRIEKVINQGNFNFEGSGMGINRVFGISFDTNLEYTVGSTLTSITADGCAILSDNAIFLTVTKEDCTPAFECQETIVATTNWVSEVTICPNDGEADIIPFLNTQMISTGEHYAYIITDENNRIEKVINQGNYNFEGSGMGINRVFGVSFDTNLEYTVGSPLTSITADGCTILSDAETFLTITKEICQANISGSIISQAGLGLEGFEVTLNNGLTARTAADGRYAFFNLPTKTNYEIIPSENSAILDGVTAFDLVLIRRHIIGDQLFDNPYQIIAADANNNGSISTFDLVTLQRLILGISQTLPNNQSWRFIDLAATSNNEIDPFSFDSSITIDNLTNDRGNLDFLGIKIGDVSSASNTGLIEGESRSQQRLQFQTTDTFVKAGQTIAIPISAKNFDQIIGYQFTMKVINLAFVEIQAGALAVNQTNFAQLDGQTITTVWSSDKAVSTDQTLFTLYVTALHDSQLSEALNFDASVTPAIAYEATAESLEIALDFTPNLTKTAISETQLLQNTPNPFQDNTTIGFQLAQAGEVNLQIFDVTGKVLLTQSAQYEAGNHRIELTGLDQLPAGLLYYQLSTVGFQATRKMLHGR